jgi:uncharacterized protein YeaO (DUF488 family)
MLKETCFPDLKKVHAANPNAIYIIVSRSRPSYSNNLYNRWYMALAPSQSLFRDFKNGLCDEEEYTRRFTEQISKSKIAQERIQTIKELSKEKDVYLICWEKTGFCHRFLLMDMIEGEKKEKQATLGE